jgi:hypothetical protein
VKSPHPFAFSSPLTCLEPPIAAPFVKGIV